MLVPREPALNTCDIDLHCFLRHNHGRLLYLLNANKHTSLNMGNCFFIYRDYLSQQPLPNGIVLPGGNANHTSCATVSSPCDVPLSLLVTPSDLSSVGSVDSSAASVCSEVASPRASPTAMLTTTDAAQRGTCLSLRIHVHRNGRI